MRVDVRLLGGFDVRVDGATVPAQVWRRRATASLVKLLALAPSHRLRREQVIDALWPDLSVERAAPRLHKAAHYARTALGPSHGVVLSSDTVSLFPEAELVVDVDLFEVAVEAVRTGDAERAGEAVELYRGGLLPDDLYEAWTEEPRERLLVAHAEMLQSLGRWDLVVAANPLDEAAHLNLVQDHVRRGDRRAALRQLEAMEKIWQLELGEGLGDPALRLRNEAEGLPIELSAARPAPRAPVPEPPTPTVGRERDIEAVLELMDTSRTVTLLGPGGVGKTRLAAEVAIRRTASTSVQSCFVDLTKVDDATLVPRLLAQELGIRVDAASDAERMLGEALRGRSLLLVLDNFEHVLDAGDLARRLVQWSPGLRVLVTSRARLRVAGEHVYDVAPLSLGSGDEAPGEVSSPADALTLFEQVARAVDPQFRLAEHHADVLSICRAVDGLPLAIELAAGHVRTLPPQLLRARLGARLASDSSAARGVPDRHRTVAATIDWSLQLLGQDERGLFQRLGVFAGAVPLEAVEQVCGWPEGDVVEALSRLVDHSLVRRVAGPRGEVHFVLLELLKERARELLAADEAAKADLTRRHVEYVAAFLDALDESRWSDDADRWIELITGTLAEVRLAHARAEELPDVHLAARITAGLGTYWHREGHHEEGRRWVDHALEHEADFDEFLVARLRLCAGFVEWITDPPLGRRQWAEAARRFRGLGHDRYLAYALALTSVTYVGDTANHSLALGLCDEAIALARQVGERPLLAQALNIRGELTRIAGDDSLAVEAYREGLDLATAAGDEAHMSMFLGNLAFIAMHRGDFEAAQDLCRRGLRLCWPRGMRLLAAMNVMQMAGPDLGLGRPERGALLTGAAEEAMRRLGVPLHPGDIAERDQIVAGLRAALGEVRYDELFSEGAQLSLDEAVVLALSPSSGD